MVRQDETPTDLTDLEYARHILENVLAWPARGNLELMADCLRSIGAAKHLKPVQAHSYMLRAITLAKEQGKTVDRLWFMGGEYTNVRPAKPENFTGYTPIDRKALEAEQATPEWQEAMQKLRETWRKWAKGDLNKMPKTETPKRREELKQQAAEWAARRAK